MLTPKVAGIVFLLSAAIAGLHRSPSLPFPADGVPSHFDDNTFEEIISSFSEPPGVFRSENLVSNESGFQEVIPELRRTVRPGGVYIGVGPEQNFTYIASLKPRLAFIVDIRRQNLLLHLLYKALIELSPTRADFVSMLFSRPPPPGLGPEAGVRDLFEVQASIEPSRELHQRNLKEVVDHLVGRRGLDLSDHDVATIGGIYEAFFLEGPSLTYSFRRQYASGFGGYTWQRFPTYSDLMTATDREGNPRSYLADEQSYSVVRDLHRKNAIVPIVGDFAGNKALRSLGGYLRRRGGKVTVFYTSNVEQYLFRGGVWRQFLDNVGSLPVDNGSLFIRAYFNYGSSYTPANPARRSSTLLSSVVQVLRAYEAGRIASYSDIIDMSRPVAEAGR
ncbi:MAG: hypothetical protein ACE148_09970 [Vicinamibacterales bacterium]